MFWKGNFVLFTWIYFIGFHRQTNAGLIEFNEMIRNYVKINPGKLIGYGNYCGAGNIPIEPLDEIDKCCQTHDLCYKFWRKRFRSGDAYLQIYKWKIKEHEITCEDQPKKENDLCLCDKVFNCCIKKNWNKFDETNYVRDSAQRNLVTSLNKLLGSIAS